MSISTAQVSDRVPDKRLLLGPGRQRLTAPAVRAGRRLNLPMSCDGVIPRLTCLGWNCATALP